MSDTIDFEKYIKNTVNHWEKELKTVIIDTLYIIQEQVDDNWRDYMITYDLDVIESVRDKHGRTNPYRIIKVTQGELVE